MKRLAVIPLLLLLSLVCKAQKEGNIWYFGENAGLDFNSGTPLPLTDGKLVTQEGCASIADKNGKLLFYTDGLTIWARNHQVMPNGNGLLGHSSSSQSGIIVPKPRDSTRYYVFTVALTGSPDGLCYSEIDLTKNGGLGDIVTKNIKLHGPVCEKLAAVKHGNGIDYWVLCHERSNKVYRAYLVTAGGVSSVPVSSSGLITYNFQDDLGYLAFTADGKKLAAALNFQNLVEVQDFDNNTGKLSNAIALNAPSRPYGVSFSHDNRFLYVSTVTLPSLLVQYDMQAGSATDIDNSRVTIYDNPKYFGALQMATDGNIYVCRFRESFLGTISRPDQKGSACNYIHDGVTLNGKLSRIGLPAIIQSYFIQRKFTYEKTCFGDATQFTISKPDGIDSVKWNFGDPVTGEDNNSKNLNPVHQFSSPGTFRVSLTYYASSQVDSFSSNVQIKPWPAVDLGNDTLICEGESLSLLADSMAEGIVWQDGSTAPVLKVDLPGTYWVEAFNGKCKIRDSIEVKVLKEDKEFLGSDTVLCKGSILMLSVNTTAQKITWQDGSAGKVFTVSEPGVYWVELLTKNCGTFSDTVRVNYVDKDSPLLGKDTTLCGGEQLVLKAPLLNASGLAVWQDGTLDSTFTVTAGGTYWLSVNTACGTLSDTIQVAYLNGKEATLGPDTFVCEGNTLKTGKPLPGAVYEWNDGAATAQKQMSSAGTYWRKVTTSCGSFTDTIRVEYMGIPEQDLGKDILICKDEVLSLQAALYPETVYQWADGSNGISMQVTRPGTYWVIAANKCGTSQDSIMVMPEEKPVLHWPPDTIICMGDSLVLEAKVSNGKYLWQDGSAAETYVVREPGVYSVKATNKCGEAEEEITVGLEDCHCYMYVPDAFTPGNDLLNETIHPSECPARRYLFRVYNRWGEMIFESEDIHKGWNGRFYNQPVPEGMYLYTVLIIGKDWNRYYQSGTFYLLR